MIDFDFTATRQELAECHDLALEHLHLVENLMTRNQLTASEVEKQLANARMVLSIYRRTSSALVLDVAALTSALFDYERAMPADYDAV